MDLPEPEGPHDPQDLAGRDVEADVVQSRPGVQTIAEHHIVEGDLAPQRRPGGRSGSAQGLRSGVEDVSDPVDRYPHLLEVLPSLGDAQDGP